MNRVNFTDRIRLPECLLLPLPGQGEPVLLRGRQTLGEAGHLLAAGLRLSLQQSPASGLEISRLEVYQIDTLLT